MNGHRAGSDAPTLLHVSADRFGRRQHPAVWRQVIGLARHFRSIVLCGPGLGYYPESHPDDERIAAEAGVEVMPLREKILGLREPAVAESVVSALTHGGRRIDAIVGHLSSGALAVHLGRRLDAPILTTFHGDDANFELTSEAFGADYARLRVAPAARFAAVSANLAERLRAFGMAPERTFVHHLGVDLEAFRPPARREAGQPLRIVMLGNFRRPKGHAMALRGFAEFVRERPGASLHFVGQGRRPENARLRDELLALTRQLDLSGSVEFHGAVPAEALPEHLARGHICLQTSVHIPEHPQVEGIPNSILEAMAMALPVVATRHGGIPEAVRHEHTGLLVEENDTAGLARALARLAADPALRDRLGRAGRAVLEAEFEIERQCARLAEHLRRMIADYRAQDRSEREAAWSRPG